MSSDLMTRVEDKFVTVDGLKLRYIEEGEGPPSCCCMARRWGLRPMCSSAISRRWRARVSRPLPSTSRASALPDVPADHSAAYRRDIVPKFMDALGLKKAALVGHSQAGNPAVQLALKEPARYSHIVVLGTGSLLPPLGEESEDRGAAVQQRLERRMADSEPTLDDTRKLLEANLFHHDLITPEELALRHARSIGQNFQAFVARGAPPKPPRRKNPRRRSGKGWSNCRCRCCSFSGATTAPMRRSARRC